MKRILVMRASRKSLPTANQLAWSVSDGWVVRCRMLCLTCMDMDRFCYFTNKKWEQWVGFKQEIFIILTICVILPPQQHMGDIKILVSKILIITCIYYHIYITLTHERENKRFEINSTNNVHKYFTPGTFIYTFLFDWVQEITHACLASSFLMLLSRKAVFKVITVVGIVLYNVLILSYNVIVPNYYALREWLAILGGVLALMAIEWNNQPTHNSKTSTEQPTSEGRKKEVKTE